MAVHKRSERPAVAVIGAGAVGAALARRLQDCGYALRAVLSRTEGRAQALAAQAGAPDSCRASADLADLPPGVRLLFCCVPDAAVAEVARVLSALDRDWPGCTAAHTSGALPAAVLTPLAERGAAVLSFHPMQAFTRHTPPEAFAGIGIGLEGGARAVARGRQVARRLGAHPVVISAEAKAGYHLAASLASNAFVTLLAVAGEVLASAGLSAEEARTLLHPLVEGTWQNLKARPPEEALTGPVVRGDRETVLDHAAALTAHLPHLMPLYAALTAETVRLAARSGRLSSTRAEALLDALQAALDATDGSAFEDV